MRLRRRLVVIALLGVACGAAAQTVPSGAHPREPEAVKFANDWLDLVERGDDGGSFELLTPTFQMNLTPESWRRAIGETNGRLGRRLDRKL